MDEEQKKGITIVVGTMDCFSKNNRLYPRHALIESLSKIDVVNVLEVDKDNVTVNTALIKGIDEGIMAKCSSLLPGLGFGLMTDVAGIPLDVRPKPYVPTRARQGKRPPKHLKRK